MLQDQISKRTQYDKSRWVFPLRYFDWWNAECISMLTFVRKDPKGALPRWWRSGDTVLRQLFWAFPGWDGAAIPYQGLVHIILLMIFLFLFSQFIICRIWFGSSNLEIHVKKMWRICWAWFGQQLPPLSKEAAETICELGGSVVKKFLDEKLESGELRKAQIDRVWGSSWGDWATTPREQELIIPRKKALEIEPIDSSDDEPWHSLLFW